MEEAKIGVFICHCGNNIGGFLDVEQLTEYASRLPGVAYAEHNLYTCSDAGLAQIRKGVREHGLNRVVVASCSPRTHEPLFRRTCQDAGVNPYLFEMANIRDQCSWVHMKDWDQATRKACDLVRMASARAALLEPQQEIEISVHPTAVVIGGGIAGLTASLSLANRGFQVTLVEKEQELGGRLNQLHQLYPTYTSAHDVIGPKVEAVLSHSRVRVLTTAQVKALRGFVGNYEVVVSRSEQEETIPVGVIIVATGARELEPEGFFNYNGRNVITQMELEDRLRNGPVEVSSVVFIQCVGARIPERRYCSRLCCMNAVKNAILLKKQNPQAHIYILYRDIQSYGVLYEEDASRARNMGVMFVRYRLDDHPSVQNGLVSLQDELRGVQLKIEADLVVLSTPMIAHEDAPALAQILKVPVDENHFFLEAHVKLRPVDFATDGIYLAGCAHFPADISESISQAYGAASRASIPLTTGRVKVEPIVSVVDTGKCTGCGLCASLCPFAAAVVERGEEGVKCRMVSASCRGCGTCAAACPQHALTMQHFTDEQIYAQLSALAAR